MEAPDTWAAASSRAAAADVVSARDQTESGAALGHVKARAGRSKVRFKAVFMQWPAPTLNVVPQAEQEVAQSD